MPIRSKLNSFIGFLAGGFLSIFGGNRGKATAEDFEQMEFKTSTQQLGVRFTEQIRGVFRFRWLKRF